MRVGRLTLPKMAGCVGPMLVHTGSMRTPDTTVRDHGTRPQSTSGTTAPQRLATAQSSKSTHGRLRAVVDRYIDSVQFTRWPTQLRMQGELAIERACQYGLGLIRMLAEFRMCEGTGDPDSVQLAMRLTAACKQLQESIAASPHATSAGDPAGAPMRRTHATRARLARRIGVLRPAPEAHGTPPIAAAASTAPRATSGSADTPDARGSA
jgi:hypothetical protein